MMEEKAWRRDVGGSHRFGLKSANNMARLMDVVGEKQDQEVQHCVKHKFLG
jgi:hypothetical protein